MGKGFGRVYKQIQPKFPYPSPKSTLVVQPHSLFTSQHDIKNDCGVTVSYHNQTLPVSNLTTIMHVDTDSKNDDETQSFSTYRKKITAPLK